MNINMIFTITAILMLFFGFGFVILPEQVFDVYGVDLNASGTMLAHVAGAAVFALGVLAGVFRNNQHHESNRLVAMAIGTFFLIKTIVTVLAQLDDVFNSLGWSIVAIDGLMLSGYVYFLFINNEWANS